jgi:hypothetical protein
MSPETRRFDSPRSLPAGLDVLVVTVVGMAVLCAVLGPSLEIIAARSPAAAMVAVLLIPGAIISALARARDHRERLPLALLATATAGTPWLAPGALPFALCLAPSLTFELWARLLRPAHRRRRERALVTELGAAPLPRATQILASLSAEALAAATAALDFSRFERGALRAALSELAPAPKLHCAARWRDADSLELSLGAVEQSTSPELSWEQDLIAASLEHSLDATPGLEHHLPERLRQARRRTQLAFGLAIARRGGLEDALAPLLTSAFEAIEAASSNRSDALLAESLINLSPAPCVERALRHRHAHPPTAALLYTTLEHLGVEQLPWLAAPLASDDPELLDAALGALIHIASSGAIPAASAAALRARAEARGAAIRAIHPPGDNRIADGLVEQVDLLVAQLKAPPSHDDSEP